MGTTKPTLVQRLRAVTEFIDTHPDLPNPSVEVRWHLMSDTDWRETVRTITADTAAVWTAHHSGSSAWLEGRTIIGRVVIFVPPDEPVTPTPDLSEFTNPEATGA